MSTATRSSNVQLLLNLAELHQAAILQLGAILGNTYPDLRAELDTFITTLDDAYTAITFPDQANKEDNSDEPPPPKANGDPANLPRAS